MAEAVLNADANPELLKMLNTATDVKHMQSINPLR